MKMLILTCVTFATISLFGSLPNRAEADNFGLHFAGPGYHVDIGRPHSRFMYYGNYYGGGGWNIYHSYYAPPAVWHDTSHYDYHPGEVVRHGNHYHYVPGHYDYHDEGHWDYSW